MADEVNELQREWRAIVLEKLSSLEEGQQRMRTDIVDIKTSFVRQNALEELRIANRTEIETMRSKLDELNAFRYKLVGFTIAANLILSIILQIILVRIAK
jgi:hypothetical protein